ncbi:aldehyde dehydrogenase family protein, partial [Pseudomonas frederiksbergensis]|nr:aldehyde dehydrogenase family protein [Pseudomonas frederiksbergensis]
IRIGQEEGARLLCGGDTGPGFERGFYVAPTLFADVDNRMRIAQEEIFGPVLVAMPFDDRDEVIGMADDNPYGLGASIWSNDLAAVHRMIPRIKSGSVWVNCHSALDPALPFG